MATKHTTFALGTVERDDFARMVTVAQIVGGQYACYCGAPAVLVVDAEPDNEPGTVCYEHAAHWLGAMRSVAAAVFAPKAAA